jgi:hypothetical protein
MRSKFVAAVAVCLSVGACNWKAGQANSAQGNISQDSRPPATGEASEVTPENGMTNAIMPQPTANEANAMANQ